MRSAAGGVFCLAAGRQAGLRVLQSVLAGAMAHHKHSASLSCVLPAACVSRLWGLTNVLGKLSACVCVCVCVR